MFLAENGPNCLKSSGMVGVSGPSGPVNLLELRLFFHQIFLVILFVFSPILTEEFRVS